MLFEPEQKIQFFSELITCSHNIHYWCYDPGMTLISSNCEENDLVYDGIFSVSGCKDYLKTYMQTSSPAPVVMTDSMGLMWIAAFEFSENTLIYIHTIGPVFVADVSIQTLEKNLTKKNYSVKTKNTFVKTLSALPVLSVTTFFQYGQMLYYTVVGEKIPIQDFHFQSSQDVLQMEEHLPLEPRSSKDSHGTWVAEQEMLRMVEEGNLDYENAIGRLSTTGSTGQFNLGDPLRQIKDYGLVFITLCSRAAMRGGLSPEIAYTLSDFYIQSVETSSAPSQIREILHDMYHDYVFRVHELKKNDHISKQIQESCNYIQIHSAEKLNIADIAAQVGYAEYYFSKKFKKEMGISVLDYIKGAKVNRAKLLLRSSNDNIQDISDMLNFSSQSYFAEIFHKYTGMTPGEYRKSGTSD